MQIWYMVQYNFLVHYVGFTNYVAVLYYADLSGNFPISEPHLAQTGSGLKDKLTKFHTLFLIYSFLLKILKVIWSSD